MKKIYILFSVLLCLSVLPSKVFAQAPTIASFAPISAKPGDAVILTGTNFSTTTTNNIVFFGATKAIVTAATAISITVTVPIGATYAPITLLNTTTALACYSLQNFNPIYNPAKSNLTTTDFAAKVDFATSSNPIAIATGDLDGDGKPELVVVNFTSNNVSIYRNTATTNAIAAGSFATPVNFATGTGPNAVVIADFDGDGKPDLAVANTTSNTISVFRNTTTSGAITTSSFASKVDFTTGSFPYLLAIGDLDGDGKPDLAVANNSNSNVSVFRNTATSGAITTSSFAARVNFTTGSNPYSVVIGDLDGDGKPDLVVSNYNSNTISVLRNTSTSGAITTDSFAAKVDFTTGANPNYVLIGDLDSDGKPDLAVSNYSFAKISIFRNTATSGAITTASFASKIDFATNTKPNWIAIGDLDGDGKPELAVTNETNNNVSLFRNMATSGTISAGSFATKVDFITGTNPSAVAIGDFDGDGKPDIAVTNGNSNNVSILRNNSSNNNLSTLTLSNGILNPNFVATTFSYTTSVTNSAITVTPTTADASATITVNGTSVNSGSASGNIALSLGNNTITVVVTAQNGTTKTYTITVVRSNLMDNIGLSNATPAKTAYSLRKMSSNYTGSAIQVRRSSDNVVFNIGFDASGGLDTTTLNAFVGAASGFVTKWYDQSGNGIDVVQPIFTLQPRIVNGGVIDKLYTSVYRTVREQERTKSINNREEF